MKLGIELRMERNAIVRFDQFPEAARRRLTVTMEALERRLEAAVRAAEPDATGALRSQTGGQVYQHDMRIAAVVGVRAPDAQAARKAAALEWGAHRQLAVRAHTMLLAHFWNRAVNPVQVSVPTHGRTPNITEQRFLRDSIDALRGDALAQIQAAVDSAIAETDA